MPVIETKERPILFSGIMIRRILAGMKTQTRRVLTPQPTVPAEFARWCFWGNELACSDSRDPEAEVQDEWRCPYGRPGDLLWVRETFASVKKGFVAYDADADCGAWCDDGSGGRLYVHHGKVLESKNYAACFKNDRRWNTIGLGKYGGRWKPSIHMPRWASRITLEVTDIRVERVQDIPEADAIAEGFEARNFTGWGDEPGVPAYPEPNVYLKQNGTYTEDPIEPFREIWDAINGPRGFGWDQNPWVWVVSFKRVA